MKLAKVKTDKSDAKAICEYALINEVPSKFVYRSLLRNKKQLDKEVVAIEPKILSLVKQDQHGQLTLLISKPGIGQKTALFLIVVTDGFSKFETAGQLCSYVGITPMIRGQGIA